MVSCGKSKEEQLIADYAQTLQNTKIDLNFKMISLEKLEDITAKDSLTALKEYFKEKRDKKILGFSIKKETYKGLLETAKNNLEETPKNHESTVKMYQGHIEEYTKELENVDKSIALYDGDCIGTFLEPVVSSIKDYENRGDEILASKFKAVYSMDNPLLKTKQEITKLYYLNGDRTKVLGTESK